MNQISINNNDFFYKQQTYNFKNNIDRLNNNANNNLHQKKFRILEDSEIILNNEKKEIQLKLNHNNYDYIKKIPTKKNECFFTIFTSVSCLNKDERGLRKQPAHCKQTEPVATCIGPSVTSSS